MSGTLLTGAMSMHADSLPTPQVVGRYEIYGKIAAGGMGTVHLGCLRGHAGASRAVAIKRLSPHLATDPSLARMLIDEARLTIRLRHPNLVPTLDVLVDGDEVLLVMDYVLGETLSSVIQTMRGRGEQIPIPIAVAIAHGVLLGLHAAHEATGDDGAPLGLVHRDVSPQNVMLGADGVPRVLDFGIAKAEGRMQNTTQEGRVKGKLGYVAPEQIDSSSVDRRADVFASAIVLWEALTLRRLFVGDTASEIFAAVVSGKVESAFQFREEVSPELDAVLLRALSRDPSARYATAAEFAQALESASPLATSREISAWLERRLGESLRARAKAVAAVERGGKSAAVDGVRAPIEESFTPSEDGSITRPVTKTEALPLQREPKRSRVVLAGAVGVLVAAGAALSGLALRPNAPPNTPRVEPAPPASASATPEPTPVVDAAVVVTPPSAPAPSTAHVPVRTKAPAPRTTKPDCRSPFVIDSRGIRVPRPECF